MVGWGLFKFSLHSWQRGANLPIVCRPTLYCLHPYFQFCLTHPLPHSPVNSNAHPPLFLRLTCFFGWMGDHATFDVLFYLMIIWIYTCQALAPLTRRTLMCVLCNKASSLLRPGTCGFLLVLWFDITHTQTQTHTVHSGAVDWHTHINIYLHHLLCAHSSYLYFIKIIKWIIL